MFLQIDPYKLKVFLLSLQDMLMKKYSDPEIKNIGRKRIGPKWVIIAIIIICRSENIAWRDVPSMLMPCEFLIKEGYFTKIPSWEKFYQEFRNMRVDTLETFISQLGTKITNKTNFDKFDVAIDSSGIGIYGGSIWRFLKWAKSRVKKTSKLFRKVHIAISLPSRAIISIARSKSIDHDSIIFAKLWKKLPKRLISRIRRMYLDAAYWAESIIGLLVQEKIIPVIPPKSNSIDHGTDGQQDLIVRAMQNYPGLYKYNVRSEWRASVEHVFGLVKLRPLRITERKESSRAKALLFPFLCYNFKLYLQTLEVSKIN